MEQKMMPCPLCQAQLGIYEGEGSHASWQHPKSDCLLSGLIIYREHHITAWNKRLPPEGGEADYAAVCKELGGDTIVGENRASKSTLIANAIRALPSPATISSDDAADVPDRFKGLTAIVRSRRKNATLWKTMAAFDVFRAAERYAAGCAAGNEAWEYEAIDLEPATISTGSAK